ncbi:Eco57I restriction-modification methylase domain-containing protein [Haliangium sp.]|uniref:Eco57I restriction-modification methylase domain-containing protein n=1 Tax=Haliangium sp. TaxID=2663208 RepID=UPI003D0FF80A
MHDSSAEPTLEAALGVAAAGPSRAQLVALERALGADRACPAEGEDAQLDRADRRAQGAFFTPAPLVDFVVAHSVGARLAASPSAWRRDGTPALRVLDPACGDGRFLRAAGRVLGAWARARGHDPAPDLIARRCLVGIERDPGFARRAHSRTGAEIHCCEALLGGPEGLAGSVDVIVGNPPYLRSIHLTRADPALRRALQDRYAATSYGEWDLYAAFLEQALTWAAPAAEVGLVVPSRWLTAACAAPLRAKLARARAVRGIVDFGGSQMFPGATTYSCVAFLTRAEVARVGVARRRGGTWHLGDIAAGSLDAAPWDLSLGRRRSLLARLRSDGPALGEVARVAKGAGTNADRVYVIEDATRDDALVTGTSKAIGAVRVEAAACRPCLRGRDVRAWARPGDGVQCIVPYHSDGRLWTPAEVARTPLLDAHLQRCRAALDARERGRHAGPGYYRFGRPQNLAFHLDPAPKIVIPDVARSGRALIDARGALVLDSAYAVRLSDGAERGHYPLVLLAAVLNSAIVRLWLDETGVLLRGGYLRLKTAYLRSLPLPPPGPDCAAAARLADRVDASAGTDLDLRRQLDEALRAAYRVCARDWYDDDAAR